MKGHDELSGRAVTSLKLGQNTKRSERDVVWNLPRPPRTTQRRRYSTGSSGSSNWIVTYVWLLSRCTCEISPRRIHVLETRGSRGSRSNRDESRIGRIPRVPFLSLPPSFSLFFLLYWAPGSRRRLNELTSRNHDDPRSTRPLHIVNNLSSWQTPGHCRCSRIFRHDGRRFASPWQVSAELIFVTEMEEKIGNSRCTEIDILRFFCEDLWDTLEKELGFKCYAWLVENFCWLGIRDD